MSSRLAVAHSALGAALSDRRRALASRSARRFAEVYLNNHFLLPPSRMHSRMFKTLHRVSGERGGRVAIAAPRGHAKSTVASLAYVLWAVLYYREPFVLLVSATKEQAAQLLRNIKHETQHNPALLADFPEVCRPPGSAQPKPWRADQVVFWNGALVRAVGANQAIRGLKHRQHRPTLIIADDLEDRANTESDEQRGKLRDWFDRTLLKSGDRRTNVVVVGTIMHHGALLARLTTRGQGYAGWESEVYRAVESWASHAELWERWENIYTGAAERDGESGEEAAEAFYAENALRMLEGTEVLWPERESYLELMRMRLLEGVRSFQSEKQNQPTDPEQCLFNPDGFRYWDDLKDPEFRGVPELLNAGGRSFRVFAGCDPSLGKHKDRGDYSAIVVVALDMKSRVSYVLEADLKRRSPADTIARLIELSEMLKIRKIGVESNQFQVLMVDDVERRVRALRHTVRVERLLSTSSKRERIEGLEPRIRTGTLRFSRAHTLLLEQMRQFPLGAHDDAPDALEMALQVAAKGAYMAYTVKVVGH